MIRELKTLIAVAQEGTFAAAGDKVGLTQAAVSAQMQRLEAELGFTIFDRSARAARLGLRGSQVVGEAQELIALYSQLGKDREEKAEQSLVNIGAIASVQRSWLPEVLARFYQQVSDCQVRIAPGLSVQLLDAVDAGKLDLAIAIRPPFALQGDLHWTTLASEPYRLLVPAGTKGRNWRQLLSSQPFIRYDRESYGGRQVDRFLRALHIQVRDICELDELEAIVRLVENGVGVALLPQTAGFRKWPAAVCAISLGGDTFHRDIGIVHRSAHGMKPAAVRLVEMVCAKYRVAGEGGIVQSTKRTT